MRNSNTALRLLSLLGIACFSDFTLQAGTWTKLTNNPPSSMNAPALLSDGTVIAQSGALWYRLKPSSTGSYLNGTWSTTAAMQDTRTYYSLQVLKDGRVFVAGGEYGTGGKNAEVFDPMTNTWTPTPSSGQNFLDSMSAIMADGRVLVAPVYATATNGTVIYDPATNLWSPGPAALHGTDEVPWLKLPDGSLLCVDGNSQSERYIPSLNQWIADANTPAVLFSGGETGCGHLLANGKAWFRGYTHTAIYTPSGTNAPGSWVAGPDIPGGQNVGDTAGAVMVNGNVLFVAGPGYLTGPTSFFEYDAVANTITQINGPSGLTDSGVPYGVKMLALPDGSTLVNLNGTLYEYVPTGSALAAAQPTITSITHNADGSYHLVGTQLNGINEGAAYGDDFQMNTNFPLVRLTDGSGNVKFARTFNWSSTGVATGATPVSTEFRLPLGLAAGTYTVAVVTNGVASTGVSLTTPDVAGDAAPTVATAAAVSQSSVVGTTTNLSVLGADTDGGGEPNLIYTWAITTSPTGISSPSFSVNGTNAAKNTTVTFHNVGTYVFSVTIIDASGLSVSSSVSVTATQTLTSMKVTPAVANLTAGQTQQFTATGLDQFGNSMSAQPTFTWSMVSGGGSVSTGGLYASPASGTIATISATTGSLSATSSIYVVSLPWVSADVGTTALTGSCFDSSGTFTVNGEGSDIWGTADDFHYVYRNLAGEGTIIARVASQTNTAGWAKAGVMIRESTAAGAAHAMMVITPSNGTAFQYRPSTGASSSNSNTGGRVAPYWVKLVRSSNLIRGYSSTNGTTWTQQSSATITMTGSTALIGLAVDSADTTLLSTAVFDNISLMAAQNDTLVVNPGVASTVNVLANDTGPSGATLTVSAFTQGLKGTVVNNGNGVLQYTPQSTAVGADSFSYTVSDGLGDTATATVNVTINGLQVYYKFEEGTGTSTADATGSALSASLSATTWTTGVEGSGGLSFASSSTSHATIPALNLNTNTATITAWVKRNGTQNSFSGLVFSRAGTTTSGLHFGNTNELRYTWNGLSSTYNYNSGLTVPDAQWTFVALVISPTNAKFYMQPLGGAMQTATNAVTNTASAFDGVTMIGQDTNSSTRCFNGTMDEVRIYNTSLNATQIAALATATPTVATAAASTPNPITSFTTTLSALGVSTIYNESALTYTWSATSIPSGAAAPLFSANGTNAAKSVTATIYQSGTYTFLVTIADTSGATVTSSINVTANLSTYDNWRGQNFSANATNNLISGPAADPDSDGSTNLLEYALNTSPTTVNPNPIVTDLETMSSQKYLRLTIPKNPSATDLTYTVEVSPDLVNWSSAGPIVEMNTSTQLIVRDNVATSSGRRFMRLRVTQP